MQLASEDVIQKLITQVHAEPGDRIRALDRVMALAVRSRTILAAELPGVRETVLDRLIKSTCQRIRTRPVRTDSHWSGQYVMSIGEKQQPRRDRQDAD